MGRGGIFSLLLLTNAVLALALVYNGNIRKQAAVTPVPTTGEEVTLSGTQDSLRFPSEKGAISNSEATPFANVYSTDPKAFAQNLKAIGCPDQTIRDIVAADVHRRFKAQEESLRPTPADHVPFAWSARTTEPRLLERRQEAASLAREEASMLREALDCQADVSVPLYAMTASDLRFESHVAATPALDACGIRQVHDTYWSDVQALLQRTKGFWLPQDLADLEALKEKRRLAIQAYLPGQ